MNAKQPSETEQAESLLKRYTGLGIHRELAKACAVIAAKELSKVAINAGYYIRVEDEIQKL